MDIVSQGKSSSRGVKHQTNKMLLYLAFVKLGRNQISETLFPFSYFIISFFQGGDLLAGDTSGGDTFMSKVAISCRNYLVAVLDFLIFFTLSELVKYLICNFLFSHKSCLA